MSGISSYYHGERGRATGVFWQADDDQLRYVLSLRDDPHRNWALDYASDVSINPRIEPGDEVVYVRLSFYAGIWVRRGEELSPALDRAVERASEITGRIREFYDVDASRRRSWLADLAAATKVPVCPADDTISDRPKTSLRVFLSYSSVNALVAHRFYEALRSEAGVEVWLDLAESDKPAEHEARIRDWLRRGVQGCQGFLVLMTPEATRSEWVRRELDWALEKARDDDMFRLVVLTERGTPAPAAAKGLGRVVDCADASFGEIVEELYAAIYRRPGRREWLAVQAERGWRERSEPRPEAPGELRSDSGEVVAVDWVKRGWDIRWHLEVRRGGVLKRVDGQGRDQVLDLLLRRGDRAGAIRHAGKEVWMRSAVLGLDPGDVVLSYLKRLEAPPLRALLAGGLITLVGLGVMVAVWRGLWALVEGKLAADPPSLAPELLAFGVTSGKVLLAATVLTYGLRQLLNVVHPSQFRGRSAAEAITYPFQALALVAWGAGVHTLVHGGIVTVAYVIGASLVAGLIDLVVAGDKVPAMVHGFPVAYGLSILYMAYRVAKLIREGPDYITDPEFLWLP